MIPDPLHPAVVHLPIALAVLLPLFTIAALLAIWRGAKPRSSWGVVVALQLLLCIGAWAAEETGERDEDFFKTGAVHEVLKDHQDLASIFIATAWGALALAVLGLMGNKVGKICRSIYLLASVGLLILGGIVGHRGGQLIYPDGAKATAERLSGLHDG